MFATSVISLSAKLAKIDGNISKNEILTFKKIFEFPKEDEKAIADIFNSAKEYAEDYTKIAQQVYDVFKYDRNLLFELLNSLFSIAYADGYLHPKEKNMLLTISNIFKFSEKDFESILNIFQSKISRENTSIDSYYKILGISRESNIEEITKKYKELAKEYHPDRLQGMGLPKEFINLANNKLTAINEAYDKIKKDKKNI